jgi:hypothetical protein
MACYVGRCEGCNQVVAAISEGRRTREEIAACIKDWYLEGLSVEKMTEAEVRAQFGDCLCNIDVAE